MVSIYQRSMVSGTASLILTNSVLLVLSENSGGLSVGVKATWTQAQLFCNAMNSTLYSPTSSHDETLLRWMTRANYSSVWVGKQRVMQFVWLNGTAVSESHISFPIRGTSQNDMCLLWREGKPALVDCANKRGMVCSVHGNITCTTKLLLSWQDAVNACSDTGGEILQNTTWLMHGIKIKQCPDQLFGYWVGLRLVNTLIGHKRFIGDIMENSVFNNCILPENESFMCMQARIGSTRGISCLFDNCFEKKFFFCHQTRERLTERNGIYKDQGSNPFHYISVILGIILIVTGTVLLKFYWQRLRQCSLIRCCMRMESNNWNSVSVPQPSVIFTHHIGRRSEDTPMDNVLPNTSFQDKPEHHYNSVAEVASYVNSPCPVDDYIVPVTSYQVFSSRARMEDNIPELSA